MTFEGRFQVGWNNLDANAHMANTASGDGGERPDHVLPLGRLLGRVDEIRVTLLSAGLSEDASRFRVRNEFWKDDGTLIARVTSLGGWLDLRARRLAAPPPALAEALRAITRAPDFEVIPVRGK